MACAIAFHTTKEKKMLNDLGPDEFHDFTEERKSHLTAVANLMFQVIDIWADFEASNPHLCPEKTAQVQRSMLKSYELDYLWFPFCKPALEQKRKANTHAIAKEEDV
jgi:hypothetical protein